MPIVTEIMSPAHLELFSDVDVIQVGAPKHGLANTLEELLTSAEYIMAGGNQNVIL